MGHKRSGQLSRADLLDALSSGHSGRINQVVNQLQLNVVEDGIEPEQPERDTSSDQALSKEDLSGKRPVTHTRATAGFWRLMSREVFEVEEDEETPLPSVPSADWDGRPKTPCQYHLLQEPEIYINQYLSPLLNKGNTSGKRLDTDKLVKHLSQAKALTRLPRMPYRLSQQSLQVIDDRHAHLIPYWTDQSVYRLLSLGWKGPAATEAVLQEGRQRPIHLDKASGYRTWEIPPSGSTVLILSDLGALSQQPDAQINTWLDIGRELQKHNCRGIVLLPCQTSLCDTRFHSYFELVSLTNQSTVDGDATNQDRSVSLLLTVLAPALRIEPGLLRQMRLDMAQHGGHWKIGAETESLLWQHADIQESHSVAATWNHAARTQRLEQFSQLSLAEKKTALGVIKQWRQPLSAQVWFEEIISLDVESRSLQSSDLQAAANYFNQLSRAVQNDSLLAYEVDLKEWLQRVSLRVPETAYSDSVSGRALQRIKRQVLPESTNSIDPSMLLKSRNAVQRVMLYQQGEFIKIMPFQEQYAPEPGYSPLATLKMAHDLLQVIVDGKQIGSLSFSGESELSLPRKAKQMIVKSDRESLCFEVLDLDLLKKSCLIDDKKTDIFIGYSHRDREVAKTLVDALKQLGHTVWWDQELLPGSDFAEIIEEKLNKVKCVIILWSPNSVSSKWVHAEASLADERGVLINLVCNEVRLPAPFDQQYNIDLKNWSGDKSDAGFQRLIEGVLRLKSVVSDDNKTAVGRDQYGLYADISLAPKLIQRFRWIPAGTFIMGSVEDEADQETWSSRETQHQVTLTEGFWLADTTVTQSQWQAITGNNPSHFKGGDRPVETVSWDDAKGFIKTINTNLPYLEFDLPSEAQWEYACRAGTTIPFSFGKNITSDQVNYVGRNFNDGEKVEYREGTCSVKSLPANSWGLYEMHGNIWEWCDDLWKQDLGSLPVIDPKNVLEETTSKRESERVIRGGSWDSDGIEVGCSSRLSYSSDHRDIDLGFRLTLVVLGAEETSESRASSDLFDFTTLYKEVSEFGFLLEKSAYLDYETEELMLNANRAYRAGEFNRALEYLKKISIIEEKYDRKSGLACTQRNISQVLRAQGDFNTALRYLEQSLTLTLEIGDKSAEGTTLNKISQIYVDLSDYELAFSYLQQSLAIQQEIGDKPGEGTVLYNISRIFQARGETEMEVRYLQKSLLIRQEIGDKYDEGTTLNSISQAFQARGDYGAALSYMGQYLEIVQDFGDETLIEEVTEAMVKLEEIFGS